ncbi:MAG: methyltransferase domain-containing protein [Myxococcales bacterium]|nr:methyltransferase domain-containing protein [Myxococcales bacterium]
MAEPPLLLCPGCRTRDDAGTLHVRTLEPAGDVLACECGRRHPVIDGVPLLLADPADVPRAGLVEPDLSPEAAAALAEGGPDDAAWPRHLEHLSIYLDAHWGDRAEPAPDVEPFASRALVDAVAALSPVPTCVELGCSTGRFVAELARTAEHVVGLDLSLGAVRRARHLLDGEPVAYARRIVGRHYAPARAAAGDRAVPAARRTLVCGDALDPPLLPAAFQRVVALNLLDAVPRPALLLRVLDGLCAPGGEVVLASPFAWQSTVMDEPERLGGADPARDLADRLRTGRGLGSRYEILEQTDLPWTLRRDARSAVAYRTHYLRARKLA